jgi:hypothetical protein
LAISTLVVISEESPYFDYQREKVFLRTSKAIRRACPRHGEQRTESKLPINREIEIRSRTCPGCKGRQITRLSNDIHSKFDSFPFYADFRGPKLINFVQLLVSGV